MYCATLFARAFEFKRFCLRDCTSSVPGHPVFGAGRQSSWFLGDIDLLGSVIARNCLGSRIVGSVIESQRLATPEQVCAR